MSRWMLNLGSSKFDVRCSMFGDEVSARRPLSRPLNHSPMKFVICNEIFQGWKLEETFAHAAKTGYGAVEIAPFTIAKSVTSISPNERQAIRDAAARAGVAISGIHWVLVQTEGLHLTHPGATIREKTSGYLCELVDFCADLGGKIMVFGS